MRTADLLVKCLEREGVRYIFGLPGEETMEILDALADSKTIRFIVTRHEQGAAFMADACGRLSGHAGVCLSTLGPGATNLATGVADATLDYAPLVAITGQAEMARTHKTSHQFIDVVEHFRPIVKWNARIERGSSVPEMVRKAFKVAEAEKPGATHLEMPQDVAAEAAEGEPFDPVPVRASEPTPEDIRRALILIEQADSPIILAGHGVVRGRAWKALRRFAEQSRLPVAETFMGKGLLPWDHELSLLSIGLHSTDYVSCGFDRADVVVAIGYDLIEYDPQFWNPDRSKQIIHIDELPAEPDDHYRPTVEVVGDLTTTLEAMADDVRPYPRTHYGEGLRRDILQELDDQADAADFPLKPQRILYDLRQSLGREDIVVCDVGAHKIWAARFFRTYEPNTVIISNGFASMGLALPGAIGAKLVHPERKVVALCGDGGFLMNMQELETACRLGTAFVAVVLRDDCYGMIGWKQQIRYGREMGVRFGNPNFVALAESFGAQAARIGEASELAPALRWGLEQDGPVVLDVPVDYAENLRLTERLGRLVCRR